MVIHSTITRLDALVHFVPFVVRCAAHALSECECYSEHNVVTVLLCMVLEVGFWRFFFGCLKFTVCSVGERNTAKLCGILSFRSLLLFS